MLKAIEGEDLKKALTTVLIYAIFSAMGSVFMMLINLGYIQIPYLTETGKAKVGSGHKKQKEI